MSSYQYACFLQTDFLQRTYFVAHFNSLHFFRTFLILIGDERKFIMRANLKSYLIDKLM